MNFYLKQKVKVDGARVSGEGIIEGKLKCGAYILLITTTKLPELKKIYGTPIRHIELEWGNFAGSDQEIIVPARNIFAI
jgi:hypothetical protein